MKMDSSLVFKTREVRPRLHATSLLTLDIQAMNVAQAKILKKIVLKHMTEELEG